MRFGVWMGIGRDDGSWRGRDKNGILEIVRGFGGKGDEPLETFRFRSMGIMGWLWNLEKLRF